MRDPRSGGVIVCCNLTHVRSAAFLRTTFGAAQAGRVPILDVTSARTRADSQAFTHDSFVMHTGVPRYCRMLVDFACLIQWHLERRGAVIVHCKNGRSRSPTVILAHFILEGMPRAFAQDWLTQAFRAQRPTIARASVTFPNFNKFDNVLQALEEAFFVQAPWISQRVAENFHLNGGGGNGGGNGGGGGAGGSCIVDAVSLSSSKLSSSSSSSSASSSSPRRSSRTGANKIELELPEDRSAFSSRHVVKGSRASKNQRNIASHNIVGEHSPDIHTVGRRVKVFDKTSAAWAEGTIKVCAKGAVTDSTSLWVVSLMRDADHDYDRCVTELGSNIIALFRPGAHVLINYEMQGKDFAGFITEWDGGDRFSFRFDIDQSTIELTSAEVKTLRIASAMGGDDAAARRNLPESLKALVAAYAEEERMIVVKKMTSPAVPKKRAAAKNGTKEKGGEKCKRKRQKETKKEKAASTTAKKTKKTERAVGATTPDLPDGWSTIICEAPAGAYTRYLGPGGMRAQSILDAWRQHRVLWATAREVAKTMKGHTQEKSKKDEGKKNAAPIAAKKQIMEKNAAPTAAMKIKKATVRAAGATTRDLPDGWSTVTHEAPSGAYTRYLGPGGMKARSTLDAWRQHEVLQAATKEVTETINAEGKEKRKKKEGKKKAAPIAATKRKMKKYAAPTAAKKMKKATVHAAGATTRDLPDGWSAVIREAPAGAYTRYLGPEGMKSQSILDAWRQHGVLQTNTAKEVAERLVKTCSKCKVSKTVSEFYACANTADGLQGWCKSCKRKERVLAEKSETKVKTAKVKTATQKKAKKKSAEAKPKPKQLKNLVRQKKEKKTKTTTASARGDDYDNEEGGGGEEEEEEDANDEEELVALLDPPRNVLIRDGADPSFCLACTGRFNAEAGEYEIELRDRTMLRVKNENVWPLDQTLSLTCTRASGDIGRRIALFYPPDGQWYVGKVKAWASSTDSGARTSVWGFGVHTIRMTVNGEEEDIILEDEKFVWMDHAFRHRRGTTRYLAEPARRSKRTISASLSLSSLATATAKKNRADSKEGHWTAKPQHLERGNANKRSKFNVSSHSGVAHSQCRSSVSSMISSNEHVAMAAAAVQPPSPPSKESVLAHVQDAPMTSAADVPKSRLVSRNNSTATPKSSAENAPNQTFNEKKRTRETSGQIQPPPGNILRPIKKRWLPPKKSAKRAAQPNRPPGLPPATDSPHNQGAEIRIPTAVPTAALPPHHRLARSASSEHLQPPPAGIPTARPPRPADRPKHTKYKTIMCKNVTKWGLCAFGDVCAFAHSQSELRLQKHVLRRDEYKKGKNGSWPTRLPPPPPRPPPLPPPPQETTRPGERTAGHHHDWINMLRRPAVPPPWTKQEDEHIVAQVRAGGTQNWARVGEPVGRTAAQCAQRWNKVLNPIKSGMKHGMKHEARLESRFSPDVD